MLGQAKERRRRSFCWRAGMYRSDSQPTDRIRGRIAAILLAFFAVLSIVNSAEATHFRYGHLTWVQRNDLAPNTAEFVLTNAFRRSGYAGTAPDGRPAVGDIIVENVGITRLFFGDGVQTAVLRYRRT
jgi:hypothetical protein